MRLLCLPLLIMRRMASSTVPCMLQGILAHTCVPRNLIEMVCMF